MSQPTWGPYRALRRLGAGGMGQVYEVEHVATGGRYALKQLVGGAGTARSLERFRREGEALASLVHPHVARVHSAGVDRGRVYLVQELLPGGSLEELLRRGPLPLPEARRIALQLAAGLAHVHAHGLLHRDLKPDNVLFDAAGNAKLCDFGLARRVDEARRLTATGTVLGSPAYMAPEQAEDARSAGPSADVFGLGGILFAMLSGRPPRVRGEGDGFFAFLARVAGEAPPSLASVREDAPPDLVRVCDRCLRLDPEERYPDGGAVLAALRGPPATARRGGARLGLALAGLLTGTVALAGFLAARAPEQPDRSPPAAPAEPRSRPAPALAATSLAEPSAPSPSPPEPAPGPDGWRVRPVVRRPRASACFGEGQIVLRAPDGDLALLPRRLAPDVLPPPAPYPHAVELPATVPAEAALLHGGPGFLVLGSRAGVVWCRGPGEVRIIGTRELEHVLVRQGVVAVADKGAGVLVLEVGPQGPRGRTDLALEGPRGVALSADGRLLAAVGGVDLGGDASSNPGLLQLWRREAGRWVPQLDAPYVHRVALRSLDLSPDGGRVLLGDAWGGVLELSLPDLEEVRRFRPAPTADRLLTAPHGDGVVRGVAYLDQRTVVSLAERKRDGGAVWEVGVWGPEGDRGRVVASGPGDLQGSLVLSADRTQALYRTVDGVYLISRP